jgi:hypothetical protein
MNIMKIQLKLQLYKLMLIKDKHTIYSSNSNEIRNVINWCIHISPWSSLHFTSLHLHTLHFFTTIYITSLYFMEHGAIVRTAKIPGQGGWPRAGNWTGTFRIRKDLRQKRLPFANCYVLSDYGIFFLSGTCCFVSQATSHASSVVLQHCLPKWSSGLYTLQLNRVIYQQNKTTDTALASDNMEDRAFKNMMWSSLAKWPTDRVSVFIPRYKYFCI